jgi:cytochrome c oxidase assembly factor CtaG
MLEPLIQAIPVEVLAVAYFLRSRTLARQGRPVPVGRRLTFTLGLLLFVVAVLPPLSSLDDELLAWHMVQHLLMGDLAALLLVLGLTGPLLQPLLALPAIGRVRFLSNPLVALPLWVGNLFLWHAPPLYQAALEMGGVHALEHACFVGFGIGMWLALLGPLPAPSWFGNGARLAYILLVRLAGALLANVFIWSGTVFYPDYRTPEAEHGVTGLSDQGLAGSIMMIEGSIVTLALFAWLFLRAAAEGERQQGLLDLAAAHGIPLDEARVKRAVASGHAAQLEQRLREQAGLMVPSSAGAEIDSIRDDPKPIAPIDG